MHGVGVTLAGSTGIQHCPCLVEKASGNPMEEPQGLEITQKLLLIKKDVGLKSELEKIKERKQSCCLISLTFCASF